jgi:hypothetical protein
MHVLKQALSFLGKRLELCARAPTLHAGMLQRGFSPFQLVECPQRVDPFGLRVADHQRIDLAGADRSESRFGFVSRLPPGISPRTRS